MKKLLKNGLVINVFTGEIEKANVLIDGSEIVGVGDYTDDEADVVEDVCGKYICPGFIDSHIHIESSFLTPYEFAKVCVPHGTTAVIADCHEIANVCGKDGIEYMLAASKNIPLDMYSVIPSCVPATDFDEAGARLEAEDIEEFYSNPRVIGLGEVMNYVGVIYGDEKVHKKVSSALRHNMAVNGHAPLLSGKDLDKYVSAGIRDDHETNSFEEAAEKIRKGQRIMIRQGTAAKNLESLLPLFDEPWASRCLLAADDKHPADLLTLGHVDDMIRIVARNGKNPIAAIRMATLNAAEYYGFRNLGAIAPSYTADIVVFESLEDIKVCDVYKNGEKVVENGKMMDFEIPSIPPELDKAVRNSFNMKKLCEADFHISETGKKKCRVIKLIPDQLLTEEWITDIDFSVDNGIDISRDILKIAVIERHSNTGHIGLGFIHGISMEFGAIAASVSHDSHNLIVIGTNESDMVLAANRVRALSGGMVTVMNGNVNQQMPLPIAGIMTDVDAQTAADQNEAVRKSVLLLGITDMVAPFMTMAFVSLPVIPHLKLTTNGLIDVDKFELVPLVVE